VQTVQSRRDDTVQVMARGLPAGDGVLSVLCGRLAAATRSTREDVTRVIRALAVGGELNAMLSVMQQSADDPAVLRKVWEKIVSAAASAPAADCAPLGAWIEKLLHDNPWICDDEDLLRAAGHIALTCDKPGLARTALQMLHEKRNASAADLTALARCHEKLGALTDALAACDQALIRHANWPDALAVRERISARIASFTGMWNVQHANTASPLMLDPLHADHAPMLARQFRDPSIATMTVLPPLAKDDDGTQWIRSRLEDGGPAYALVHRQLGFVGSLELRVWESTAFISCWIGSDFQGQGFYHPALMLGCELATRNGVDLILSAAFDDNIRSLRGLRKCGFQALDVRAQPPDADRTFVTLSRSPIDNDEAVQRLTDFCINTESGLRFDAQQDTESSETNPSGETS
jgi:RimJ/RimL family protein N-acetyltransferase